MLWDVVVVGAGAAGLLAAARAAESGQRTLLLEKNRRPGVKIMMSGGTRCNLTHDTDRRGMIEAFGRQGRFLHSALAALGPRELVQLIESEGVPTKVEETGKVFPVSDRAADVLQALRSRLDRSGAELLLDQELRELQPTDAGFRLATGQQTFLARRVIVTTGGQSYPGCGTTGDGFRWARALGHTVITPRPALTPITTSATWVQQLSGLTLPDVAVKVVRRVEVPGAGVPRATPEARPGGTPRASGGALDQRRGSFLFTHFGLSGPAPLDVSRTITGCDSPASLDVVCDFLPATTAESLNQTLQQECTSAGKRQIGNLLAMWLPGRLAEALIHLAQLPPRLRAAELSKPDRLRLVELIKGCAIPVTGTKGFEKAEVTAGGVSLDEVDSRTLQSKRMAGLYFAGEVLDLDGPIGGYNFQAAFSTGWLAGQSAATSS